MLTVLLSVALAADVYLNGVAVDVLPDATLANVTVRLDPSGKVWITAPQYNVQEVPATAAPRPSAAAVPPGRWWLVSQDDSGGGHVVDVVINGVTVRRVQSGEAQILVDVGLSMQQFYDDQQDVVKRVGQVTFRVDQSRAFPGGVIVVRLSSRGRLGTAFAMLVSSGQRIAA